MDIMQMKLSELKPYENNPRINDEAVEKVAESIRQFGFNQPIVVDENNVIVVGHTRYRAARKLGIDKVPVYQLKGLSEEQYRAYRLADNKTAEFAEWDMDLLNLELDEITNIDMADFGFDINFDDEEKEIEEDEMPEVSEEPKAKLNDLFELGEHRLICGDSTDVNVIERLMDGVKADMVFTDPPYGMNAVSKSGVLSEHYKTDIMNDDDNTVAIDAFNLAREYFKGAKQIWWGANYYTECLPSSECWIVWDKNNGASDQTDCELAWANMRSVVRQFTMASEKTNRVHPTQKPCKLFAEILHKFDKDNSVKNVVDLFGGSGSTLIACEQLNRKCYMCELDPKYVQVIIDRYKNLRGSDKDIFLIKDEKKIPYCEL